MRTQDHARVHALATVAVALLAWWLRVPSTGAALLALAVGGVWTAEAFNTALEVLADRLHPERHPSVGAAKDLAAAAVLLAALAAAAVGLAVLGPPLVNRVTG